jgi:predicted RNA binding protein YcfA (HicA-like mRNA interferase family)
MSKRISPNKDLNQLIKKAQKQGWVVEESKGNHLRWVAPCGYVVISPKTPSDFRAIKYVLVALRKYGYKG